MPFKRQTLEETVAEVEAGLASRLPGADTRLRRSVLAVLARVVGGVAYGLDYFIYRISQQVLPDTAEGQWLERHSRLWKIYRKQAAAATGTGSFTGVEGAVMPAGTLMQRPDGTQYESTAESVIQGGAALVPLRAVKGGAQGNAKAEGTLSLVSPVVGFEFNGKVAGSGISGGSDTEQDEALRKRLITRWHEPPQGGCAYAWKAWALEVPGVTRAWALPRWMGLGTVGVVFVTDEAESPIPDETMVQRVEDYLTDPIRKPITADVYVVPPVPKVNEIVISGLDPATEAVKEAVRAELRDLYKREAEPGRMLPVSHIREAISTAAGEYDHALVSPDANIYPAKHELPMLGNVVFLQSEGGEDESNA